MRKTLVSHLLVLKAIYANMFNLMLRKMAFMSANATDNAQSMVKLATIWQA